jgi:hypothetical protein
MDQDLLKGISDTLTQIRNGLGFIDRNQRQEAVLLKSQGSHAFVKRIGLASKDKWYPVQVPPNLRSWFVQAIPTTAKLKIGYGESDNLQEQPPQENYSTISPATPRSEHTSPKMIWLQSDTDNTIAELELWV